LWDSPPAEWGKPPPKPVRDGLAVAGLVVGVFAVLLCWTGLPGVLLGLGAAGLGLRGHQEARRGRAHNPGLATVSTVLGAVAVVGGVVALLLATR
jgi:hypothetical protein